MEVMLDLVGQGLHTLFKFSSSVSTSGEDGVVVKAWNKKAGVDERYASCRSISLDKEGSTQLHRACKECSPLAAAKSIIDANPNQCSIKDRDGLTPLHLASMKGRLDIVKVILDASPQSAKHTSPTGETCLHAAVGHNRGKVVQYLVKWLYKNTDYIHLLNAKDCEGNTAIHLATSRKQLQTLKSFLSSHEQINNSIDVNATNSGGFTALDILYVLPHGGNIDMKIDRVLRRAGALRSKDTSCHSSTVDDDFECQHISTTPDMVKPRARREYACGVLLVTATILATITFHAACSFPSTKICQARNIDDYAYGIRPLIRTKDSASTTTTSARSFIFFNSTGFIASVAIIVFLLHEFPMKPWPQISATSLFGSYMCLIREISPKEAMPLLFLSIPFLLFAASGKIYGFSRPKIHETCCHTRKEQTLLF